RFSSKEVHVLSGMYYYGYRFYDPNLQRWINRDPIGEPGFELMRRSYTRQRHPINQYVFVDNSPLVFLDGDGLDVLGDICSLEFKRDLLINAIKELMSQRPLSPARQAELDRLLKQLNDNLSQLEKLRP